MFFPVLIDRIHFQKPFSQKIYACIFRHTEEETVGIFLLHNAGCRYSRFEGEHSKLWLNNY
jgi:hypothetical protein